MNNTKVKTIEGFENIKEYYYSINNALEKNEEVLVFGARSGNSNFQDAIDFFVNYIHDRSSKDIKTKILYNEDVSALGKTYEQIPLVQVRYMPMGLITKVGVNIYRDTIDMLDWSNPINPKVIVIEDKYIADSYREYFNLMWSSTVAVAELEKRGNFYLPEILFENFINHSDENQKVEEQILSLLNEVKPKNMLNIGAGFDTLSQSPSFPGSVKDITIVEKNTSFVSSYTDEKTTVIHSDFEKWESDEKYDFIIASHVLFYLKDKKKAVEQVLSHLNEGGRAIFVLNKPEGNYKRLKDYVFGFQGKKYFYTYDKLQSALAELGTKFKEIDIDCTLEARDGSELYKAMRLWFEMDLNNYYQHEKEIITLFPEIKVNYTNTMFVVYQ
ncbi:methyltransferase domain-containing protein [Candidatus Nomurabacteria bacterium]|nr:methyltransferase domain-containing protein [Candidatus Nomurabacteria bacterium]